jgi:hypothetical protein
VIANAVDIPTTARRLELHERQTIAWSTLDMPNVRELLYGGAKGGGKSVFLCAWCFAEAKRLIRENNLKPTKNPIPVGWMGRVQGSDFMTTTLETWKAIIPEDKYRIKHYSGTSGEIVIDECVKIVFSGLDNTSKVKKFNSAEFVFFALDQAEEATQDQIGELRGSLRRKINGKDQWYRALFTANPRQCYLKEEFIVSPMPERRFVQALPSDNPHVAANYIETLTAAFRHRPELLEAYLHGSWDAFADDDQIIRDMWIRSAMARQLFTPVEKRYLSVDPARFGNDEAVVLSFTNTDVEKAECHHKLDADALATKVHLRAIAHKASVVGIDEIGLGGPVGDILVALADGAYEVMFINGSNASSKPKIYGNLRAEIWDTAAQMLATGQVVLTWDDVTLRTELCTPKYSFKRGLMYVQDKDEIREILGHSPDRGDSYTQGLWMYERVPNAAAHPDRYRKEKGGYRRRLRNSVGAMSA